MEIAESVGRLGRVDGVVGVVLGGSRARGTHIESSDYDLAVYYEDSIDLAVVKEWVHSVADPNTEVTVVAPGEWGPWINGGAWLTVDGAKVDLLYRELGFVTQQAHEARVGTFTSHYQVGHPSGYHSFHLLAEVAVNQVLHDPSGALKNLQTLAVPYPEPLRSAIIDKFLWEAGFQLEILERTDFGSDPCYEMSALSRFISCVLQVLYARSRIWFLNEKRALQDLKNLGADVGDLPERLVRISQLPDDALLQARSLLTEVKNDPG